MRLLVLGATGSVGRLVVAQGLARGHAITAQTRDSARGAALLPSARVMAADATDATALAPLCAGQDAVIFALGTDRGGPTTLFSDATRALLAAMAEAGVARLVALTGVGAGETRGHGGFLYDRIIFPLFTRHRYADKDRQEALIRASGTDWTILRPAPFAATPGAAPMQRVTAIAPTTRLTRVTREEVAAFALDCAEQALHMREAVFFGHGRA
jgi:putative NADH-flavin reductase